MFGAPNRLRTSHSFYPHRELFMHGKAPSAQPAPSSNLVPYASFPPAPATSSRRRAMDATFLKPRQGRSASRTLPRSALARTRIASPTRMRLRDELAHGVSQHDRTSLTIVCWPPITGRSVQSIDHSLTNAHTASAISSQRTGYRASACRSSEANQAEPSAGRRRNSHTPPRCWASSVPPGARSSSGRQRAVVVRAETLTRAPMPKARSRASLRAYVSPPLLRMGALLSGAQRGPACEHVPEMHAGRTLHRFLVNKGGGWRSGIGGGTIGREATAKKKKERNLKAKGKEKDGEDRER